jgi:hypothetical protein
MVVFLLSFEGLILSLTIQLTGVSRGNEKKFLRTSKKEKLTPWPP